MKHLLLVCLLALTGCTVTISADDSVDYNQVDTAYPSTLLTPPEPVSNDELPDGTFYRDESDAYVAELDAYIAYLKRHRNGIQPEVIAVQPPTVPQCETGFIAPQRPQLPTINKVVNIGDDREVIMAMKYYILDLKKHIIDYDIAVGNAYREWQKKCSR